MHASSDYKHKPPKIHTHNIVTQFVVYLEVLISSAFHSWVALPTYHPPVDWYTAQDMSPSETVGTRNSIAKPLSLSISILYYTHLCSMSKILQVEGRGETECIDKLSQICEQA